MSEIRLHQPTPDLLDAIVRLFSGDHILVPPEQREQLKRELGNQKLDPGPDMHVLWELLQALLDDDFSVGGECNILDMACGRCEEVFVLSSLIASRMEQLMPGSVRFYGSDVREGILMRGKASCTRTCRFFEQQIGGKDSPFRYSFRAGDGTGPEVWAAFPDTFDVVFFRHQNMYHGMDIWSKIFATVVERLKPGGRLIITSYFDHEHGIALNVLKSLGMELIETVHNPRSRVLVTEGKSVDRHIAILQLRDKVVL